MLSSRLEGVSRLVLLALPLALGCAEAPESELLSVNDVTPPRVEPGQMLHVTGSGFPPGGVATVRVRGMMHRAGHEPSELQFELEGRAASSERVDAHFDDELLRRIGGRGTLHGTVSVRFRAARSNRWVIGTSGERTLDFAPSSRRSSAAALASARQAAQWLSHTGLHVGERSASTPGLPVLSVDPGSVAEAAGLAVEDQLLSADGITLYELGDLAPASGAQVVRLEVRREGLAAAFEAGLPVLDVGQPVSPELLHGLQVALFWLFLTLVFFGPTAGLADAIARRIVQPHRQTSQQKRQWVWRAGIAFCASATLPVLDRAGWLHVPLEAIVLTIVGVRLGAIWFAVDRRASRLSTLRALGSAVLPMVPTAIAFFCVAALAGTTDLSAINAQQSWLPTTWTALRTPLGPAFAALAGLGACAAPAVLDSATRSARLGRAIDDLGLWMIANLSVVCLMSGWSGATGSAAARSGAALLFIASATALFAWLRRARGSMSFSMRRAFAAAALSAAAAAATAARVVSPSIEPLEHELGWTVIGATALLAVLVVWRSVAGRVRAEPRPTHAFL